MKTQITEPSISPPAGETYPCLSFPIQRSFPSALSFWDNVHSNNSSLSVFPCVSPRKTICQLLLSLLLTADFFSNGWGHTQLRRKRCETEKCSASSASKNSGEWQRRWGESSSEPPRRRLRSLALVAGLDGHSGAFAYAETWEAWQSGRPRGPGVQLITSH